MNRHEKRFVNMKNSGYYSNVTWNWAWDTEYQLHIFITTSYIKYLLDEEKY